MKAQVGIAKLHPKMLDNQKGFAHACNITVGCFTPGSLGWAMEELQLLGLFLLTEQPKWAFRDCLADLNTGYFCYIYNVILKAKSQVYCAKGTQLAGLSLKEWLALYQMALCSYSHIEN